jgi:anti-sigma regulatory factor (Ser/Thr protein kinase)
MTVPSAPEFASTLRVMVACLGADAGCSLDEIDDLRLALTEVFSLFDPAAGGRISVAFDVVAGGLEVEVAHEDGRAPEEPDLIAHTLLTSVVDSFLVDGCRVVIRKSPAELTRSS